MKLTAWYLKFLSPHITGGNGVFFKDDDNISLVVNIKRLIFTDSLKSHRSVKIAGSFILLCSLFDLLADTGIDDLLIIRTEQILQCDVFSTG